MKRRNVVVSDDAVIDIEDARAFYERQENGLGEYFISCLVWISSKAMQKIPLRRLL